MKSVALYARVSSERQAQQATVDSQVAALRQRIAADGHTLLPTDVYVDDGYSGATLVRPALERLRDRAAEGALELLYVHSPDRLARRYAYQVLLLDELSAHGISVIFLQGAAGGSAEDQLLTQVQGMIAEYERAKIIERNRRGRLHRARQGCVSVMGHAPFGYVYLKRSDTAPAAYRVVLHEAKIVRRVFEALVYKQKSMGAIARELNAEAVPTRRGAKLWVQSAIQHMVMNPAYMGKAAFGRREKVERHTPLRPRRGNSAIPKRGNSALRFRPAEQWITIDVPPIISPKLFAAARDQLDRNVRMPQRNTRTHYLLQGLTVCAGCGYAFIGRSNRRGDRVRTYYGCIGGVSKRYPGGRVCDMPAVRGDALDAHVWDSVVELLNSPRRVMDEWSRRISRDAVRTELQQHRDECARDLDRQERSLQRLLDAYEAGLLDLNEFGRRSKHVRAAIDSARDDLTCADEKLASSIALRSIVARLEAFRDRVREGLDKLSWENRRQLIRMLVARVEINADDATVVYRVPPTPGSDPPRGPRGPKRPRPDPSCRLRTQRHQAGWPNPRSRSRSTARRRLLGSARLSGSAGAIFPPS